MSLNVERLKEQYGRCDYDARRKFLVATWDVMDPPPGIALAELLPVYSAFFVASRNTDDDIQTARMVFIRELRDDTSTEGLALKWAIDTWMARYRFKDDWIADAALNGLLETMTKALPVLNKALIDYLHALPEGLGAAAPLLEGPEPEIMCVVGWDKSRGMIFVSYPAFVSLQTAINEARGAGADNQIVVAVQCAWKIMTAGTKARKFDLSLCQGKDESNDEFDERIEIEYRRLLKERRKNIRFANGSLTENARTAKWTAQVFAGKSYAEIAKGDVGNRRGPNHVDVRNAVINFARRAKLRLPSTLGETLGTPSVKAGTYRDITGQPIST